MSHGATKRGVQGQEPMVRVFILFFIIELKIYLYSSMTQNCVKFSKLQLSFQPQIKVFRIIGKF